MAGGLGSRDGPFHPRDYRFYAQTGSNSHFMRRQNYPSNRHCPPEGLLCTSPAMQRPALGTTLWCPSRPETAGSTVMVSFAIWACWRGVASHQLG